MNQYFGETATKINKKGDAMGYKRPLEEMLLTKKPWLFLLIIVVATVIFAVASAFAGTLQTHVFSAGVTFDAVGVSTQGVVGSTETIRGGQ